MSRGERGGGRVAVSPARYNRLRLSPKLKVTDTDDVFGGDKMASRASGDYVIMGDNFCAGGCGMINGMHKEAVGWRCPFMPKARRATPADCDFPPEVKNKVT